MPSFLAYFARRPLLINVVLLGCLLSAIFLWPKIGKEEMPEFAMNWLRINILYPGAAAEDVELFITKPVEEKLKTLSGIEEVKSTSAFGSSSFRIEFSPHREDEQELIADIKEAVDRASLPQEAEEPIYSRFMSSEKAILDIGFYHREHTLLSVSSRQELQKYAHAFEQRLLSIPEVSGFNRQGYLHPEIHIIIHPERLQEFNLSLAEVKNQIHKQHVRLPVGSMSDPEETEISVSSELNSVERLRSLVVRSSFAGKRVTLAQLATIEHNFAKSNTIRKAQGHEAIIYNIKKNQETDIIAAQKAVFAFLQDFRRNYAEAPFALVTADDESYDVKNRLSLIGANGLIGFILIILVLFIFLDFKSGVWVAMGIPFTLAFTLICALILGYSINNMTLAAIIIVLGIVVDDAIIVAENIARCKSQGRSSLDAVVEGTSEVFLPVVASILTTCAAFVPLYFFSGHFGLFVRYMPTVIFLMLFASLIESGLLLPGHLHAPLPFAERKVRPHQHSRFLVVEKAYGGFLAKVIQWHWLVIALFMALLLSALWVFHQNFKFVMFPREESKEISIKATGPESLNRFAMAEMVRPLEEIFLQDKEVVKAVLTRIGQNRRGGAVKENHASIRVEILPPDEREQSLRELMAKWQKQAEKLDGFAKIRFLKSRWGSSSGSPIVIEVRENSNERRQTLAEKIRQKLASHPEISDAEVEKPLEKNEIRLQLKHEEMAKLGINPKQLATSLRTYVEGQILYHLHEGDEEVDVRLLGDPKYKQSIATILDIRASNHQSYLVPMSQLVDIERGLKPSNIQRIDYKRSQRVYADLTDDAQTTPLELAEQFEKDFFPELLQENPSAVVRFRGEVLRSRESQSDFSFAVIMVMGLIYTLLVLLYSSLTLPFVIASVIPFGLVGVIFAFWTHDMSRYGFFAVIGTLGMIGVVVNDAIVMVTKLEQGETLDDIAGIAATRLRPILVTTLTTAAGLFPTAYGLAGYDSMLSEMMLAMGWGLVFATSITLIFLPCVYSIYKRLQAPLFP